MPFAIATDGVRIHYEVEGSGTPLVLLHGMASNLRMWRDAGYVALLRDHYALVLVDSRGHGLSDKPQEASAYQFQARVGDLSAVVRDGGFPPPHLWGYSMGGGIAQTVLMLAPSSFRSIVVGGSSPYGARDSAVRGSFEDFWPRVSSWFGADRHAWAAAFAANRAFGGHADALATTSLPYLLYAGSEDEGPHRGLQEFVATHAARYFVVPGQDHGGAWLSSADFVVPRVLSFLREVDS